MAKIFADISVSLDGYVAGPDATIAEPLGKNGERLHDWVFKLAAWREPHGLPGGETGPDNDIVKETTANTGAVIMGRKMFSNGTGPWENDPKANGWWGDNPPFHCPVFILTHHPRESVELKGGNSFHFVTDGVESAMRRAKEAAGNKDIQISGGAHAIQQYAAAGMLDELQIHVSPILLHSGVRLFENMPGIAFEKTRVIDSPGVTHIKFRVKNA